MNIPSWDDRPFLSVSVSKPNTPPGLLHTYRALVDTGATNSMISPRVISQLSLPTIDTVRYSSASESNIETTLHVVDLRLPTGGFTVEVAKLESHHPHFQVLLGMDVLSLHTLTVQKRRPALKLLPEFADAPWAK